MIRFRFLTYSNFGLVEKWLNEMACQGWQLKHIRLGFIHSFQRNPNGFENYRISLNENEGMFNAFSKRELAEYDEITGEEGWQLIARSYNMNIYQVRKGAVSSLYDERAELSIMRKSIKREIISIAIMLFLFFWIFFYQIAAIWTPEAFYQYSMPLIALGSLCFLIFSVLTLIDQIWFQIRNRKAVRKEELKFSCISFSYVYVGLFLATIMFALVGVLLQVKEVLPIIGVSSLVLTWIPLAISIAVGLTYRKKIKTADFSTKKKRSYWFILFALVIFVSIILNIMRFHRVNPKANEEKEVPGGYMVTELGRGFPVRDHRKYRHKTEDFSVEEAVCLNENLARELISRYVNNARKHPFEADRVQELTADYPFDQVYRLSNIDTYVLRQGSKVLIVDGDLTNPDLLDRLVILAEAR